MNNRDKDERLIRYLLGELTEQERAELEQAYFVSDAAFEELSTVEDELIEAYVQAELSPADRERFERGFLTTPRRRERVDFTRRLKAEAAKRSVAGHQSWWQGFVPAFPVPRFAFALAIVATIAVALGIGWRVLRPGPEATEPVQARRTPPPSGSASQPGPQAPLARVAAFVLTPGLTRGTGPAPTLTLPKDTTTVRLKMEHEGEGYAAYRAILKTAEGRTVQSIAGLKPATPGTATCVAELVAKVLTSGDYVLTLSGRAPSGVFEDVADYSFRVVKQ